VFGRGAHVRVTEVSKGNGVMVWTCFQGYLQ